MRSSRNSSSNELPAAVAVAAALAFSLAAPTAGPGDIMPVPKGAARRITVAGPAAAPYCTVRSTS
jgi:hypothetical protein